jgi:hypothetical protein
MNLADCMIMNPKVDVTMLLLFIAMKRQLFLITK